MASTYLTNTNPTAGNRTKGTISVWFKRSGLGSYQHLYTEHYDGNNFGSLRLNSNDTLSFLSYDGGSAQADIGTTRVFRDTNSWYHVVASWDTTDGTASDRVKIYINGVRETSFSGSPTYPSSSQNIYFGVGGTNYPIRVGSISNSAQFFDGSMSHFHRVDNQALAPTVFGSTDLTTGEWKISTSPSITYTGSSSFNFFILKDGNSVTDQSGQSNNLTVGGGTLTKTEDNPSNVFATLNTLIKSGNDIKTVANGNTSVIASSSSAWASLYSNLGASTGKFYCEVKITDTYGPDANNFIVGVRDIDNINQSSNNKVSQDSNGFGYRAQTGNKETNNSQSSYGNSYTTGNIVGIAMDLDNSKLYFSKDGVFQNSGDPTSGATGTGSAFNLVSGVTYAFGVSSYYTQDDYAFNFGNGFFGTTEITTNTGTGFQDADGNGRFFYNPPANFRCLSTKGINQ